MTSSSSTTTSSTSNNATNIKPPLSLFHAPPLSKSNNPSVLRSIFETTYEDKSISANFSLSSLFSQQQPQHQINKIKEDNNGRNSELLISSSTQINTTTNSSIPSSTSFSIIGNNNNNNSTATVNSSTMSPITTSKSGKPLYIVLQQLQQEIDTKWPNPERGFCKTREYDRGWAEKRIELAQEAKRAIRGAEKRGVIPEKKNSVVVKKLKLQVSKLNNS
jgi:hypothetical protein